MDRKLEKELTQARQAGDVAPAVDAATGQMINPHNPEFITKRPWYLAKDDNDTTTTTLQHQVQNKDDTQQEFTLSAAEQLLQQKRLKEKERMTKNKDVFIKGQWVEALKKGKLPYRICQIINIYDNNTVFDLQYEDGTIEKRIKMKNKSSNNKPRIRATVTGNRVNENNDYKETYDSKRDTYHGYDHNIHNKKLLQKFEQKQDIRKKLRIKNDQEKEKDNDNIAASDSDFDDSDVEDMNNNNNNSSDDDDDDEFVQRDEDAKVVTTRLARQGGVGGAQMKVTARNLRIREDTAKYLRNLDPNSAYYDPKSRSMRDNPNPELNSNQTDFVGDNFARISGDAVALAQQQLFAWDATTKTANTTTTEATTDEGTATILHPQANPSQVEILKKQFETKTKDLKQQRKQKVLNKYGGEEYLEKNVTNNNDDDEQDTIETERKLRFGVSTETQEYNNKKQQKQQKRIALKSKYDEDIYINGHTSVWGSYFHIGAFTWGYDDDHSLIKMSYCTGINGKIANDEANTLQYGTGTTGSAALAQAQKMITITNNNNNNNNSSSNKLTSTFHNKSKLYGEADPNAVLDTKKVQEAMKKQQQQQQQDFTNNKKRKYNSIKADDIEMTEEMMEAYRIQKQNNTNDPMANINSNDELLDYKK